jgi:hypothetical protein
MPSAPRRHPGTAIRPPWQTLPYAAEVEGDAGAPLPPMRARQATLVDVVAPPPSSRTSTDASAAITLGRARVEQAKTRAEAARVCAAVVCEALRARAVLVLVANRDKTKLRIVGVAGASASDFLGETISSDDFVSSAVLDGQRTVVLSVHDETPGASADVRERDERSSLIAVPILADGRCVGVIEVVDAATHDGAVVGAVEHLARFVARFLAPRERRASGVRPVLRASPLRGEGGRRALFDAWLQKRVIAGSDR